MNNSPTSWPVDPLWTDREVTLALESATRELSRRDQILEEIAKDIRVNGFDFVDIQLINKEHKTIETVFSHGLSTEWFAIAKHTIQGDPGLWDINASVAMHEPPVIEIIAGHDRRFDRYLFEKFAHCNHVRVFVPIILAPSEVKLESMRWDRLEGLFPNVVYIPSHNDRRTVFQIHKEDWAGARVWHSQVIGTIEAGFYDSSCEISPSLALQTALIAGKWAWNVYRASLDNVFSTIARGAISMIGASAACLYFAEAENETDTKSVHYVYEASEGRHLGMSPTSDGLGQLALQMRKPLFMPDPDLGHDERYLREVDRHAYDAGLRAVAAIPIVFSEESDSMYVEAVGEAPKLEKQGLLYVGFDMPHSFTADEITKLEVLASRAVDAIRVATNYTYTRNRARVLANLHQLAQSLADNPASKSTLEEIAGVALNILAADIVLVYEYDERQRRFVEDRPTIAGRSIEPPVTPVIEDELSVPALLLQTQANIYSADALSNPILAPKQNVGRFAKSFVARERVKSAAAVILKGGSPDENPREEIFGLIFINYRTAHYFTAEERKLIETIASTAAIAIRHRRILSQRSDLTRAIEGIERIERAIAPMRASFGAASVVAGSRRRRRGRSAIGILPTGERAMARTTAKIQRLDHLEDLIRLEYGKLHEYEREPRNILKSKREI
jgi:GAF domain-containing protein